MRRRRRNNSGKDPEDAQIAYLERKLGLTGPNQSKSKTLLQQELRSENFDPDFIDFLDQCIGLGKGKKKRSAAEAALEHDKPSRKKLKDLDDSSVEASTASSGSNDENFTHKKRSSNIKNLSDNGESRHEGDDGEWSNGSGSNDGGEQEENSSDDGISSDDGNLSDDGNSSDDGISSDDGSSSDDGNCKDDRGLSATSNNIKTEAAASTTNLEECISSLMPKLKSIVNRISEGSLTQIVEMALKDIFQKYPHMTRKFEESYSNCERALSRAFAKLLIDTAVTHMSSTASLVSAVCAFVAGLTALATTKMGEQFLVQTAAALESTLSNKVLPLAVRLRESRDKLKNGCDKEADNEDRLTYELMDAMAVARHAVEVYGMLYDFGLLSSDILTLVLERIMLLREPTEPIIFETQADLLCTALQYAGFCMKQKEPEKYKQLGLALGKQVEKAEGLKGDTQKLSLLTSQLQEYKEGKFESKVARERIVFVRQWLSTERLFGNLDWSTKVLTIRRGEDAVKDFRRLGRGHLLPVAVANESLGLLTSIVLDPVVKREQELETLAVQLGVHTPPLRKKLFLALMSGSNIDDGTQNVLRLVQTKMDVSHAVALIMHLTISGKEFNPFFAAVLCSLCSMPGSRGHQFQRETKRGVVAQLGALGQDNVQISHFGKFIEYLMSSPLNMVPANLIYKNAPESLLMKLPPR